LHAWHTTSPAVLVMVPDSHFLHPLLASVSVDTCPAGQLMHGVYPLVLHWPMGHFTGSTHCSAPMVSVTLLPLHCLQLDNPNSSAYVFMAQGLHVKDSASGAKLPVRQGTHEVDPGSN
jgi:hypothetical protein